MNIELLKQVQEKIKAEPDTLEMSDWGSRNECGTVACICGWGLLLSGNALINDDGELCHCDEDEGIQATGMRVFDLDDDQAFKLFYIVNWPDEFRDDDTFYPIDPVARIDHFIATEGRE